MSTGRCRLTFSAASGLSGADFDNLPVAVSKYGLTPGFVSFQGSVGTIDVLTCDVSGVAANRIFTVVVYAP